MKGKVFVVQAVFAFSLQLKGLLIAARPRSLVGRRTIAQTSVRQAIARSIADWQLQRGFSNGNGRKSIGASENKLL